MLIRNSIRQLKRTPVKSFLFLILISFATILCSLGVQLWKMSDSNVKEFEKAFTTIGTVEQKKTVMKKQEEWDSVDKISRYYYYPEYNAPIPLSVLDFQGADYLQKPEKRPFYGAYLPDYKLLPPNANWAMLDIIVQFSVDQDCVPDHEIEINIKKQLFTRYLINTKTVWFCDRYNPKPDKLYAGKTYIMAMASTYKWTSDTSIRSIYTPVEMIGSVQYTKDGKVLPDDMQGILYEEVTKDFDKTEHGKRWLALAKNMDRPYHTVAVTPTNDTNLLIPFYGETTYVDQGRDISKEEYENGDKVCLISNSFARRNNIKVGDKITLPLYYANYQYSAGRAFVGNEAWNGFRLMNAKGEPYPVFYKADYTIVGVYVNAGGGNSSGYTLAPNEIIIPTKSVKASDKDNIISYGPMMGYNTSFQIANGSIDRYKKAFQKLGYDELELVFYDKGYSQLRAGLDNIKNMSLVLLAAGLIATILILSFFCNLFIAKQKKRTAIERSLGMSKWRCIHSMISGVVLIVLIGSVIGCLAGYGLTNVAAKDFSGQKHFSTEYTSGSVSKNLDVQTAIDQTHPSFVLSIWIGLVIVIFSLLLSYIVVTSSLRYEPLELLSQKSE